MLRIVAIPLWFISVWFVYGLVAYFLGVPADGGAVIGALAGSVCREEVHGPARPGGGGEVLRLKCT